LVRLNIIFAWCENLTGSLSHICGQHHRDGAWIVDTEIRKKKCMQEDYWIGLSDLIVLNGEQDRSNRSDRPVFFGAFHCA
jgi:hypothetical protein